MKKIRIGIELDHVIRNINKQIAKYYQQDYDDSIDLDELDYKDDLLHTLCKFKNEKELKEFVYENYPLEIFGHAPQMSMTLSRDLNFWIKSLTNQEEYDVEVFFYSLKEFDITIQSTYFFLSKIGSRVRKVYFPKSIDELSEYGDVFITANSDVVGQVGKPTILIRMNFNKDAENQAEFVYDSMKQFLNDSEKFNKIVDLCSKKKPLKNQY